MTTKASEITIQSAGAGNFRPEIQGLRAIAVMAVVTYHLFPSVIRGGYVGVDIFFVISGYLITGLLARELDRTGHIALGRFYARRIKRLLPAASAVLVAVALGTLMMLPDISWVGTAKEIVAAAVYVENWWLAGQAVDYLNADAAASPVQHFWSLSIEEQYYLLWPCLFVLMSMLVSSRHKRVLIRGLILTIAMASLGYSIYATRTDQAAAYFLTTTRVWELAVGGLLALLPAMPSLPAGVRMLAGWVGLAGMGLAIALYTKATPFPGYAALLPTVSAALVIFAGEGTARFNVCVPLGMALPQYLGGISYSLYLWHWPLIVFAGYLFPGVNAAMTGGCVLLLSLVLAHATKVWVEEPYHKAPIQPGKLWRPYAVGGACIAACVVAAGALYGSLQKREAQATGSAMAGLHPGGAVLTSAYGRFVPALAAVHKDNPDVYLNGCHGSWSDRLPKPGSCTYGPAEARRLVVLLGDSHAAQWASLLEALATKMDFRLVVMTKSSCPFLADGVLRRSEPYIECQQWDEAVQDYLAKVRPALVVVSQSRSYTPLDGHRDGRSQRLAGSLVKAWKRVHESGARILVIQDTPRPGFDVPECMARSRSNYFDCYAPRSKAVAPADDDPLSLAARTTGEHVLDMADRICGPFACAPVVGGVLVWRDSNHLTKTYTLTLAEPLRAAIKEVMP